MPFYGWGVNKKLLILRKLKIFLTLVCLLFALPAFCQEVFRIENGIKYDESRVQPFMRTLLFKNDFVVAFRTCFQGEAASESRYFVLTGRGEELKAYLYSGTSGVLNDLHLSSYSMNQIWKTFQQNDLFRIRDEKDIANFCAKKYEIYESYTYEFTILSQGKMKVLSYYSPEYYIEACYGISERLNIINSVAIINFYAHQK